jgi:hypothetical protein
VRRENENGGRRGKMKRSWGEEGKRERGEKRKNENELARGGKMRMMRMSWGEEQKRGMGEEEEK